MSPIRALIALLCLGLSPLSADFYAGRARSAAFELMSAAPSRHFPQPQGPCRFCIESEGSISYDLLQYEHDVVLPLLVNEAK